MAPVNLGPRPALKPAKPLLVAAAANAAPAERPVAAKPQAQGPKGLRFDSIEAYKAHVRTTEVTRLPALRQAVAEEQGKVAAARQVLGQAEQAQGLKGKQEALASAERALEAAKFPFRPQAEEKRAEASRVSAEAGQVAADISRAQGAIVAAKTRSAVRDDRLVRDMWNDKPYSGWEAAADVLGSVGNASAARQAQRSIEVLSQRKATLEAQVMSLTAEALPCTTSPAKPPPWPPPKGCATPPAKSWPKPKANWSCNATA